MTAGHRRRRLTRESDLWDCYLMADYLGLRPETVRRNATCGHYPDAFQCGGLHSAWRFPNPLKVRQLTTKLSQ